MKRKSGKKTFLSAIAVIALSIGAFWLGSYTGTISSGKAADEVNTETDASSNPDLSSANSVTEDSSDTSGSTENTQSSDATGSSASDQTSVEATNNEDTNLDSTDTSTVAADTSSNNSASDTVSTVQKDSILYTNTKYGFQFSLPKSWDGYSIQTEAWQGTALNDTKQDTEVVETGDKIIIRNPKWTTENPYQDIPIMIFTAKQWKAVENGDIAVSAAPIIPSKIGSNSEYVFAIPARYNYAFPTGYEEVEDILASNPLAANEVIGK